MSVNIEGLSSKELAELISRANQRKKVLAKRKPAAQVKAAVSKLLKAAAPKPARKSTKGRTLGKVAPKYRNPANAKDTWASRGKQPKWLAAETAKGRKLEEFLIK